jgi:type I restriction enzyme S subunit
MKKGWQAKRLGDVCEIIKGRKPALKTTATDGDLPYLVAKVMRGSKEAEYASVKDRNSITVEESETIIICDGSNSGEVFTGFRGILSSTMGKIAKKAEIDDDYLRAFLASTFDVFNGAKTGAAIPHLDKEAMYQLQFPFPPLAEQQRIVGLLDEAFEGLATAKANAEKNLQNARALFESALNAAIQGELIPQDSRDDSVAELIDQIEKARNVAITQGRAKAEKSEPLERKMDGVIKLPRTWKWAQLESLTVCISDGVHKKPHYVSTGVPFITVKNLTAGPSISFEELNYVTREDHEEFIKRTHPEKGDILITKDGTIGVVRLIDTDIEFSIFVSVALIKPVMRELAPYLVYALRASCVQSQIVPQGAALKHLYLVDLRRLAIPLPPLKEQKRIVAALDALSEETQNLARLYERKHAALEALKKSLLQQALTGVL